MRRLLLAISIAILPAAACDNESSLALDKAGIIPVGFDLSPEVFQKWRVAQTNLENEPAYAALELPGERIDLRQPSKSNIDRVVDGLSQNEPVKRAIEGSGLSVRDYVLATVALNQAMLADASSQTGAAFLRNREIANANRTEIERFRRKSRFGFVDSRRVAGSDTDSDNDADSDSDTDSDTKNDSDRDSDKNKSDKDSDGGKR